MLMSPTHLCVAHLIYDALPRGSTLFNIPGVNSVVCPIPKKLNHDVAMKALFNVLRYAQEPNQPFLVSTEAIKGETSSLF